LQLGHGFTSPNVATLIGQARNLAFHSKENASVRIENPCRECSVLLASLKERMLVVVCFSCLDYDDALHQIARLEQSPGFDDARDRIVHSKR
jgi:hypothetical protein